MLKRLVASAGVLAILLGAFFFGARLTLYFYVLLPLILFPCLYFSCVPPRTLLILATALSGLAYLIFAISFWSLELAGLGGLLLFEFWAMIAYRNAWRIKLRLGTIQTSEIEQELKLLKQKHQSRLESLGHLEKQVGGLLDLFEIARDFVECLSFQGIAEILHKKVLPELPFTEMRLIMLGKMMEQSDSPWVFTVTAKGVQHEPLELSVRDHEKLEKIRASKQMQNEPDEWIFPVLLEPDSQAFMFVRGAVKEDLVKFEVLSAYLTLQVKKVRLYQTVKELATRDSLTGIFVRRHFLERFEEELKRSMKFDLPLAVLMLDIDHFKRYNDDHGHLAGDATLKHVASIVMQSIRKVDIVARYGGEEFVVLMPETKTAGALEAAERIRSGIARHEFKVYNQKTQVTVSVGVALFPSDIKDSEKMSPTSDVAFELIRHADKALYRAKEDGRNRVVLFGDLS